MTDETTPDAPTVESVNKDVERLTGDLENAQNANMGALEAMRKNSAKANIEELGVLAGAVSDTHEAVGKCQTAIEVAERGLARIEWESKTQALREVLTPIGSGVRDAINAVLDVFKSFNVTGLVVTVDAIGEPNMETSVKPTGPDIPKPPAGVKRGGGGGGKRASHSVTEAGTLMTPREYVAAHAEDSTDIIRAYLGGDTSHKVNLTHEAERIAKKLGHDFS
ncbi:hypothetical protein LCGC14_0942410 [marine sediment metagenome]|uniref:Uncharacterized protein n=1 Tax=marine sediment metagenome TaxID=412755 RepID=A0A0F9P5X0_9ZZZZ